MKRIQTEFDEVVYSTDLNLRHNYEGQTGMKHGLPFVLEEYRKLAASTPWRLYTKEMLTICLAGLAVVGAILAAFINSEAVQAHGWSGAAAMVVLVCPIAAGVFLMFYNAKDSLRKSEMSVHYEVLKKFADAVGFELTPIKNYASQHWTRIDSIEPSLVQIGQDIIWAELHFDALCRIGRPRRDDIVVSGAKLQSLDMDLAQGLRRAELFGLKLKRAEVMVNAQKLLGHTTK